MKLTIGMIVKNEEKWLDKCLSAIKPILDNVDSELIVTDTGSTDKTVEIAKKYTDKVLHFDWIGDFSAARNFGLEKAQGEWFMMLDADDIFRSCDNITEFFNSGEYKKYNAASYISRNIIKTENGDTYGDILAPRMVKLHPETRYVNAIHEYLTTFDPPYKNLKDIADHYGYYYETQEQKQSKFRRNSELLLKRLEKEKDTTPMLYVQLYEAYSGVGENDKALGFLDRGIELSEKLDSIVLAALYFYKVCHLREAKKYDEAIAVCGEYFGMSSKIRPYPLNTDGEIYALKAECLFALEKYGEAVDAFGKFLDTYKDIESGKISTYDSYLVAAYMCSAVNVMPLFNDLITSCILADKYSTADNYLRTFPFDRYSFELKEIHSLVQSELKVAARNGYKNIAEYHSRLDAAGKKMLADELFDRLKSDDTRGEIFAGLDRIGRSDKRTAAKADIYKAYYAGGDCFGAINGYISGYGVSDDIDLVYLMMKKGYDLSAALNSQGLDIKQCAYLCCKNIPGFYEAAEGYDVGAISDNSAMHAAVKLYDYSISMRLMENEDKPQEEKEKLIAGLFAAKTKLKERCRAAEAPVSEFEKLSLAVKKNIRAFIAAGKYDEARKTLDEYRRIAPGDPETAELDALIG